jgi:D-alanyl-D-alanine carboxypeptidase
MNTDQNDIAIGSLSIYYKLPYTLPTFEKPKAADMDHATLEQCVGTYTTKALPLKMTVFNTDKGLRAQATGQASFPLTPTGALEFQFEQAGVKMTFHQSSDGKLVGFTLVQNGATLEFTKE